MLPVVVTERTWVSRSCVSRSAITRPSVHSTPSPTTSSSTAVYTRNSSSGESLSRSRQREPSHFDCSSMTIVYKKKLWSVSSFFSSCFLSLLSLSQMTMSTYCLVCIFLRFLTEVPVFDQIIEYAQLNTFKKKL